MILLISNFTCLWVKYCFSNPSSKAAALISPQLEPQNLNKPCRELKELSFDIPWTVNFSQFANKILQPAFTVSQSAIFRDRQEVKSLHPCLKAPRIKSAFRPDTKSDEWICQLSVIPGKKSKDITRCAQIERKDQGYTVWLV